MIIEDVLYACGEENLIIEALPIPNPDIVGNWSTNSGTTIIDPHSFSTLVTGLDPGPNVFVWSYTQANCLNFSTDTMVVFNEEPAVAFDDSYSLSFNESLIDANILDNDILANVEEINIRIMQLPEHGSLINDGSGIISYRPTTNFFGTDIIVYELCNANCDNNCSQATIRIMVSGVDSDGDCLIPDVITPNGDGVNDIWVIPCIDEYPNNQLTIFNRWGDKVFEASPYMNNWDGTFRGNQLPRGTYFYVLKLTDDPADEIQGYITLTR